MSEIEMKTGWELPAGYTNYNQLVKGAGDELKGLIPTVTYKAENVSKDQVLNSELFKKLGKNQIILFEGHGSFEKFYEDDVEMHSVMWTGRDYQESEKETNPDYLNYNLIPAGFGGYEEALTSGFIEEYVGDLTGSIVYLGNCFSARETTFAQSFLRKGAAAVIGNTHTTQSAYNSLIEYSTIKFLGEINPETKKTNTLFEAMAKAKQIYGKTDAEKYPAACGSEPTIYGDAYFCLSSFKK